jgi:hypothetical protein
LRTPEASTEIGARSGGRRGSLDGVTASGVALLTATAVHLGFQLTVTALVYPALARVPAERWAAAHDAHSRWAAAHDAHSRTITVLVAVIYGALAVTGGWALLSGPGAWTLLALAAVAATWVVTGFAAQVHGRLGAGHDAGQIRRLLRIDRVRAGAAVLALAASVVAVR